MSAANKVTTLTPKDINDAYAAHGKDMLMLDLNSMRESDYGQYPKLQFKLADGKVVTANTMRLKSPEGLTISGSMKDVMNRKWPSLRVRVSSILEDGSINENAVAMGHVCESFETLIETLVAENKITTKTAKATKTCKLVKSTEVETAMDSMTRNRETGELEQADTPSFWINIPKKRWWNAGEAKRPQDEEAIEDAYYLDKDGNPSMDRPVTRHDFQPKFFNVNNSYFSSKTGKQFFRTLGDHDEETNTYNLDNSNVHKYLTRNSQFIGDIKMEVCIVKSQCKLNLSFGNYIYVNHVEATMGEPEISDDVLGFANKFAASAKVDDEETKPAAKPKDEYEEDQYDNDDF